MATVNLSSLGMSGVSTGIDTKALVSAILTNDTQKINSLQSKQKQAQTQISTFEKLDDYAMSTQSLLYKASNETDRTAFVSDLKTFVETYNASLADVSKDSEAKAVLMRIKQTTSSVNGDYISNYGISTNRDGSLSFDAAKAAAAISSDEAFTKVKGTMVSLAGSSSFLNIDSYIHGKIMRSNDQSNRLDTQITREKALWDKKAAQLTSALAKMEAYAVNNAGSQSTLFKINTNA